MRLLAEWHCHCSPRLEPGNFPGQNSNTRCNMCRFRQYAAGVAVGLMAFLSGCAERPLSVPASASLMTEGSHRVSFRATDEGRVYVTDDNDKKILYQGEINKGEMVEVNAQDDRIMIGGRTVSEHAMD